MYIYIYIYIYINIYIRLNFLVRVVPGCVSLVVFCYASLGDVFIQCCGKMDKAHPLTPPPLVAAPSPTRESPPGSTQGGQPGVGA